MHRYYIHVIIIRKAQGFTLKQSTSLMEASIDKLLSSLDKTLDISLFIGYVQEE